MKGVEGVNHTEKNEDKERPLYSANLLPVFSGRVCLVSKRGLEADRGGGGVQVLGAVRARTYNQTNDIVYVIIRQYTLDPNNKNGNNCNA